MDHVQRSEIDLVAMRLECLHRLFVVAGEQNLITQAGERFLCKLAQTRVIFH